MGRGSPVRHGERGAAAVDFSMVSVLLLAVFLAVVQMGLALHVRNTLVSCAAEGARAGARADAVPGAAVARTQELVGASLSTRYARSVSVRENVVGGVRVVEVRVVAPVPVLGLLGPADTLDVTGRAFAESQ
ncbi:TadE family protein [Phycicoccus flavus]|uniref:TadE family protein n=1 Tax=Phycicoccus flavus TaxID=2502783 RepID=UPI000FEBE0C0|nr:TadE family protein [Phycicoccus flavus]NHA69230.1 pilus assembly protein [Phycicoccus flavus]